MKFNGLRFFFLLPLVLLTPISAYGEEDSPLAWYSDSWLVDGVRNIAPVVDISASGWAFRTEGKLSASVFPGFRAGIENSDTVVRASYRDIRDEIAASGDLGASDRRVDIGGDIGAYSLDLSLAPGCLTDSVRRIDWKYRQNGVSAYYGMDDERASGNFFLSYSNLLSLGGAVSNDLVTHRLGFRAWLAPGFRLGADAQAFVFDSGQRPGGLSILGYLQGIAAGGEFRIETELPAGAGWLIQSVYGYTPGGGQDLPFLSAQVIMSNRSKFLNAVAADPLTGYGVALSNCFGLNLAYRFLSTAGQFDATVKPPQGYNLFSINGSLFLPLALQEFDASWTSPNIDGFRFRFSGGLIGCPADDWQLVTSDSFFLFGGTVATNVPGNFSGILLWNAGIEASYRFGDCEIGYSFMQMIPEILSGASSSGHETNKASSKTSSATDEFYGGGVHRLWCRFVCW
jgi:hypothetical protein